MCGITGTFTLRGEVHPDKARADVARMTKRLQHRGPDDTGIWHSQCAPVSFGHRRLSIIDLSDNGRQPMSSANGRVVITYNGEIYNFQDIRTQLVNQGVIFRGRSDTEVLTEAIATWGWEKALPMLNGMFAIGIWLADKCELVLARDRMGQKPLYWGEFNGTILFASEIKAIREHSKFYGHIDRVALHAYVTRSYVPSPQSIYQGLRKLQPGTAVVCRRETGVAKPVRFAASWRPSLTDAVTQQSLKKTLCGSVARHLVADVPVAILLSGGVDSSLIAAISVKELNHPIISFVARFDDPKLNESHHAKAVGKTLGLDVTELSIDQSDILNTICCISDIYDEPFADSSQIPTLLMARAVRTEAKVFLTGDGADELFFGYDRYVMMMKLAPVLRRLPKITQASAAVICRLFGQQCLDPLWGGLSQVLDQRIDSRRFAALARVLDAPSFDESYRGMLSQWQNPSVLMAGGDAADGTVFGDGGSFGASDTEIMDYIQTLDVATYLPDDLMVKTDRAAMSVGLEARMPFLDAEVVEAAQNLSYRARYANGMGKNILRGILDEYIPSELTKRPKQGFSAPIAAWLRAELHDWAADLLHDVRMRDDGFFNPQPIKRLWREHQSGARDWSSALWTVLMFQQWRRSEVAS